MVYDQVEMRFFVGATECLEKAKVSYIRAQHVFLLLLHTHKCIVNNMSRRRTEFNQCIILKPKALALSYSKSAIPGCQM